MKNKKFLVVTEEGVIANGIHDPSEVMAVLMYAYLSVWNRDISEIDVVEAGEKIVEMLDGMSKKEEKEEDDMTLLDALKLLFCEDDDDGET